MKRSDRKPRQGLAARKAARRAAARWHSGEKRQAQSCKNCLRDALAELSWLDKRKTKDLGAVVEAKTMRPPKDNTA